MSPLIRHLRGRGGAPYTQIARPRLRMCLRDSEKSPKNGRFSSVFGPALGRAAWPAVRWENTVFAPGWRGIVYRMKCEGDCILGEGERGALRQRGRQRDGLDLS